MKLCFETSGEHPTIPLAELSAALWAVNGRRPSPVQDGRVVFARCKSAAASPVAVRLALCHAVSEVIAEGESVAEAVRSPDVSDISGTTIKVRARIVSGVWTESERKVAERMLGGAMSRRNAIDLRGAATEMRVILGKNASVCRLVGKIDRARFEARKGENRPFFSPVSLHPKYARVLVNLSRAKEGGRLLDPFCGTGGILIEASLCGLRALGSDLDARMVEGAATNLSHFGLRADLERCDVAHVLDAFGEVDAIATDPPYGRASSTGKEGAGPLHRRMLPAFRDVLKEGGRAAVVLPDLSALSKIPEGLEVEESHALRVHRSLVRNFVVLRKSPSRA